MGDLPLFDPLSLMPPTDRPWGINFGGGANSTALVISCFQLGHRPDWILFCDTGSEKPETYAAIDRLRAWVDERGFTPISITRWDRQEPLENGATFESLEDYSLRTRYMPSKAYGLAGCSDKYKTQPAERWRRERGFERTVYALGYDAGETRRVTRPKCARREGVYEEPWYPLFAWGITRKDCNAIIANAGLPPVPKSACFFCPNMKPHEWRALSVTHPELFARALEIERRALEAGNAKEYGLLRSAGWLKNLPLVVTHFPVPEQKQNDMFDCGCFESTDDFEGAA